MSYKTYLYGQVIPFYVNHPNTEPYPIVSQYKDLHTTGLLALTPDPLTQTLVNGTKYTAASIVGAQRSKYYAYVPAGWTLVAHRGSSSTSFTGSGYLVLDEAYTHFSFSRKPWVEFRRAVCLGEIDFRWDEGVFLHLIPHQDACDQLVTDYCSTAAPNNPICNCIREEAVLRDRHPFNSTDVTCLGDTCGERGYRTRSMMRERCSIKYCGEFVDGDDIKRSGKTTINCGGVEWDASAGVPTLPVSDIEQVSTFTWAILGVSVLVWSVLFYLLLRFFG